MPIGLREGLVDTRGSKHAEGFDVPARIINNVLQLWPGIPVFLDGERCLLYRKTYRVNPIRYELEEGLEVPTPGVGDERPAGNLPSARADQPRRYVYGADCLAEAATLHGYTATADETCSSMPCGFPFLRFPSMVPMT